MEANIKRIGGNVFEVSTNDGLHTILVSYETPVAIKNAEGVVFRTATRWSRSTERHITEFLAHSGWKEGGYHWLQENLDRLLFELIGDTRLRGRAAAVKLGRAARTEGIDYDAHTEPGDRHLVVPVVRRSAGKDY